MNSKDRESAFLERHTEPMPRPVRRRVGIVVVLLFVGITGWAVTKHAMTGGLANSEIEAGVEKMAVAIHGDRGAFEQAEEHFLDAASVSPIDAYPGFLIRANQRIEAADTESSNPHDRIAVAVSDGEFVEARELARTLGAKEERAGEYWVRLIDALASVAER